MDSASCKPASAGMIGLSSANSASSTTPPATMTPRATCGQPSSGGARRARARAAASSAAAFLAASSASAAAVAAAARSSSILRAASTAARAASARLYRVTSVCDGCAAARRWAAVSVSARRSDGASPSRPPAATGGASRLTTAMAAVSLSCADTRVPQAGHAAPASGRMVPHLLQAEGSLKLAPSVRSSPQVAFEYSRALGRAVKSSAR